ncbi:GTPase Era [Candidatus Sumerlaeota bacterium]|nr:GTPase Era [Candidatus Sumerlaeota bacterium]
MNEDRRNDENCGEREFRSGFVAIIGKPNAGKSTLLNRLVGGKIAIVSPKPQTTRDSILGILSDESFQIVFVDTPGLIESRNLLNRCLIDSTALAVKEVDLAYHIVDIADPKPETPAIKNLVRKLSAPRILVANKIDRLPKPFDPSSIQPVEKDIAYTDLIGISALQGDNVPLLIRKTVSLLPEGPLYFDPEQMSDRDLRFLSAEIVREKAFELLGQEIPYSLAVQVEEFKERPEDKDYIRAVIYVERESQKGMVIGAGGNMLKQIGSLARPDIEELVGKPVFLELWVKVRKNWTKKETDLRHFGYFPKKNKE